MTPADRPLDVPAGFQLQCQVCGWPPDVDITMGLVVAHFDTEHGSSDVRLDLVVVCPRCHEAMRLDYRRGDVDVHACDRCHRTRKVRRERSS